jgi:small subunit ribosomal protein S16
MVKIRLKRLGATKRPFYRVVVADSRSPRDGRFIEQIGKYHPMEDPSFIEIDGDRALYWLNEGAQPTEQVRNLLRIQGVWERFESGRAPAKAAAASRGGASKASATKPPPAADTSPDA